MKSIAMGTNSIYLGTLNMDSTFRDAWIVAP